MSSQEPAVIKQAFMQCPGIGPVRLELLRAAGIRCWVDAIEQPDRIPFSWRDRIVEECERCEQALADDDLEYLINGFAPQDRWRVLAHAIERTTFFDVETTGLEYDAPISVIVCWHRGQLHTFVEHENLDDFLDLLDDVQLLSSFNGSSFDVPRVLDSFHIPQLPCPHLDLRWLCYHRGFRGGLKQISAEMGLKRPADLAQADGELAIKLWTRWQTTADAEARHLLVRYCGSDVLLTAMLAWNLLERPVDVGTFWSQLPENSAATETLSNTPLPQHGAQRFGAASPSFLRGWRRVS